MNPGCCGSKWIFGSHSKMLARCLRQDSIIKVTDWLGLQIPKFYLCPMFFKFWYNVIFCIASFNGSFFISLIASAPSGMRLSSLEAYWCDANICCSRLIFFVLFCFILFYLLISPFDFWVWLFDYQKLNLSLQKTTPNFQSVFLSTIELLPT